MRSRAGLAQRPKDYILLRSLEMSSSNITHQQSEREQVSGAHLQGMRTIRFCITLTCSLRVIGEVLSSLVVPWEAASSDWLVEQSRMGISRIVTWGTSPNSLA